MTSGPDETADAIATAWERERPGTDVVGMRVVTRVWQLAKLFGDTRRRVVTEQGADLATLDLLSTLRRAGPPYALSTRELAARSMVTAGAISQRLARAERDGLVERARAAGERTVHVTLSDAGHALVERLVDVVADADRSLLAGLDPRQVGDLDALLAAALADLGERFGPQAVSHVGAE